MVDKLHLQKKMQKHVELWRSSGLKKQDYTDKIGISRHKLSYWIQKSSKPESSRIKESQSDKVEFVEFMPSQDIPDITSIISQQLTKVHPCVELTFPGGLCLKIF